MTANAIELHGILREDGTLVLDARPNLPPGRVKVTVEPMPDLAKTDVWQILDRIWAGQRARGHIPRTREQVETELEAARNEDEERMQALERIHAEYSQANRQRSSAESK